VNVGSNPCDRSILFAPPVTTEPTDDSVEIAVGFVKEVGQILEELSPQGTY
jgi:hypothetical protein